MREAIAICQSLPGPLAIQVGIYVSYLRTGFWGAWAGGWAFIFPNFVIVAALGALYVHLGDLQPVNAIFYGVSPAVISLILHSCYRLAKPANRNPLGASTAALFIAAASAPADWQIIVHAWDFERLFLRIRHELGDRAHRQRWVDHEKEWNPAGQHKRH